MPLTAYGYDYSVAPSSGSDGTVDWINRLFHDIDGALTIFDFEAITRVCLQHTDISASLPAGYAALCSGDDGRVYLCTINAANAIVGYNPTIPAVDKLFNSGPSGLPAPGFVAPFSVGGTQYIVSASANAGAIGALVWVINMTAVTYTGFAFNVDEETVSIGVGNARMCKGSGNVIVTAFGNSPSDVMGYYIVNPTSKAKIGVVTPAQLGGATTIGGFGNPGFDNSDGNILQCIQTNLGIFLCKINATTCAVMWMLPIPVLMDLQEAYIHAGRLKFVVPGGSPFTYLEFDTKAGVQTNTTSETVLNNFNGLVAYSDQFDLLISKTNQTSGAAAHWATFGIPPFAPLSQGGVIRVGC